MGLLRVTFLHIQTILHQKQSKANMFSKWKVVNEDYCSKKMKMKTQNILIKQTHYYYYYF